MPAAARPEIFLQIGKPYIRSKCTSRRTAGISRMIITAKPTASRPPKASQALASVLLEFSLMSNFLSDRHAAGICFWFLG
jgi:hypothetical protein